MIDIKLIRENKDSKGAQEAHEAIRPSYIENHTIEGTPAEKKLYDPVSYTHLGCGCIHRVAGLRP